MLRSAWKIQSCLIGLQLPQARSNKLSQSTKKSIVADLEVFVAGPSWMSSLGSLDSIPHVGVDPGKELIVETQPQMLSCPSGMDKPHN